VESRPKMTPFPSSWRADKIAVGYVMRDFNVGRRSFW
jgi:hypothetical protein